ncbi:MAG: bis(5'-nucleosyl)-tetraphosphatase (symmetrical) YqeK [Enterococcus aquimarinus]|uniref:bis(5'-nucleosyl)-tetraphosphatase (symmetrical) n=1 Tax=Enterococcus aquimarinus TaxID=328396 RepID=A0A9E4DSV4_9ENTE|nr:bis(5'-nucleosyl)-tetraphosphatase (symmetrical) YqeK [Enterococcus aquimarinus]
MIKLNPYTEEARLLLVQQVQMQMSEARFEHVLGVEQSAIALAKRYGCSVEKASIAALTHDYAKERSADEFRFIIENKGFDLNLLRWGNAIWHGLVGAYFVEHELGITDHDILEAIRLHTTGAPQMSLLSKIIYVADYIEPGRDFPGVEEARRLAVLDLDQAVAFETKQTLQYLIGKNVPIYPKTIETYNQWVAKHL